MSRVQDSRGGRKGPPGGTALIDRMVVEARLDNEQYQRVLLHSLQSDGRVEDALVESGVMSEPDLLRYLAALYQTQFVSSQKLARLSVDRSLLQKIPRKLAERLLVFPILFDPARHALSVVAADLAAEDVGKQVQLVSLAREVKTYVARPAAIQALIRKHYDGVGSAFAWLGLLTEGDEFGQSIGPPRLDTRGAIPTSAGGGIEIDGRLNPAADPGPAFGARPPSPPRTAAGRPAPPPAPNFMIAAPEIALELSGAAAPKESSLSWENYLEATNVLITLLEQGRAELRGHSSLVGRLARKLAERLGLPPDRCHAITMAAYLHDIGKSSSAYHLTALNVGQYEGHRVQAKKSYLAPLRLFESAKLPEDTEKSITHLYERVDGEGFPDRLTGKDIPLGARILAIVETYADLTMHAKNPFRAKLEPQAACDALDKHKGTLFDPNLVDVFRREVLGEDLKSRLLAERRTVLLVDPDPEETTVLEMRLMEQGHEVVIARNADDALERMRQSEIDMMIVEVELGATDGFVLVERVRSEKAAKVVFLTRRGDRESIAKGFRLGAVDYLVKPVSAEVVAAKVSQKLQEQVPERRAATRGVSGSLKEMSLPDVVQILAAGRKSGQLTIRSGSRTGSVSFADGQILDASFGAAGGEEAFYAMLAIEDGEFELDPSVKSSKRTIEASAESLLLEGLRRLDEANV